MKIVAVRIGNRYGPEYETYLESKLPQHEFIWIRESMAPNIILQWNKMYGMTLDVDEPIVVMDIDVLLVGDYNRIFDYPVKPGQFLAAPGYWRDLQGEDAIRWGINGGFYKYYPKDCTYIYDKFMAQPEYYQRKYIEEGHTSGPVNGEQHFIEDSVKERLELIILPNAWFCRMDARDNAFARHSKSKLNVLYKQHTGNDYMYLGKNFHPDIKHVHFTHMDNHPSDWEDYKLFV